MTASPFGYDALTGLTVVHHSAGLHCCNTVVEQGGRAKELVAGDCFGAQTDVLLGRLQRPVVQQSLDNP